jgi:hypothetical protein
MDAVNAAMKRLFDALWAPFAAAPLWVGLLVLGIAFGVLALLAMKYTTNPKRVSHYKDRYQGHILAIKLFRDSFTVVISSLAKTLAWIGAYLTEQFKPMIVMLVPFMLLFAQMVVRLSYRPLDVGTAAIVTIDLASGTPANEVDVKLELPPGLVQAGLAVREPSRQRVVVPIKATLPGAHVLKLTCGGETVEKTIHAGDLAGPPAVSPIRTNDFWDRLLYPGEPSFGASSRFESVALTYPIRAIPCFGIDLSFGSELGMMGVFVLITIVAAFGLKGVFGVTI